MNFNLSKNKTVLTTGGVEFIDSNLYESILRNNIKTIYLDNFSTDKRENLAPFIIKPNFKFIKIPLGDKIRSLSKLAKPQEIRPF